MLVATISSTANAVTDSVYGTVYECNTAQRGWWFGWTAKLSGFSGNIYGDPGYTQKCRIYDDGEWVAWWWKPNWRAAVDKIKSACFPWDAQRTANAEQEWKANVSDPSNRCWILQCKTRHRYYQGDLNLGTSDTAVDFKRCEKCNQPVVNVVTHDPTEVTYLKTFRVIGAEHDCPPDSDPVNESDCQGYWIGSYNSEELKNNEDQFCVRKGCKCKTQKAQEYKDGNGDYVAKCGNPSSGS